MAGQEVAQVLVVDDEPELRELLVDALSAEGMEITSASSGKEAIDLARTRQPDLLVTDLNLGDCDGLEVIDRIRSAAKDEVPAVVITGYRDADTLTKASRCRPVELMTKPLDVARLRDTVREELDRQSVYRRHRRRDRRLRHLARKLKIEHRSVHRQMNETCEGLTAAYRSLSGKMALQQVVLSYQQELLGAKNDDGVFRSMFHAFVKRSGPVHGIAMVCDADAELQMIGRFGVPYPDNSTFCLALARPLVGQTLANPTCTLTDAGAEADVFDESIRKYLPGVSVLTIPLMPTPGEMIGLVLLYRKGEQPFTAGDVTLAEMIAPPTALAVRRND